ncbi:MAG: alginate export family protein [Sandarakinorhabdus sp.]|jgi:hypothetical protein|nr:alginate export family protein [Sandarakinorhabdus sp.]
MNSISSQRCRRRITWGLAFAALGLAGSGRAEAADPITPYANIRYRIEAIDQQGLPEDALASTLRLRAGVRTQSWHGLSAVLEGEGIVPLGAERYNDTANGRTNFPIVPDGSGLWLNQAIIRFQPVKELDAAVGRQAINFDNQRWIGSVDWRQNDQTLDAARLGATPVKNLRVDYVYAWRVNRVFGPDSPIGTWRNNDIHLARVAATLKPLGTVTAYGWWLDIPDAPAASSRTLGARLVGEQALGQGVKLVYAAEFAQQRGIAANPARTDHTYLLIEPGIAIGKVTLRGGFEELGGDGRSALQTPLATAHLFNGWTDRFLTTPPAGLRDVYADLRWQMGPLLTKAPAVLWLRVHDYRPSGGGPRYGREVSGWFTLPIDKHLTGIIKASHYQADSFATDTTKFWVSLDARF